jgi:hypothetical protein
VWERGLDPWGPLSRICRDLSSVELKKFKKRFYIGFRIVGCDRARAALFKKEMKKGRLSKVSVSEDASAPEANFHMTWTVITGVPCFLQKLRNRPLIAFAPHNRRSRHSPYQW